MIVHPYGNTLMRVIFVDNIIRKIYKNFKNALQSTKISKNLLKSAEKMIFSFSGVTLKKPRKSILKNRRPKSKKDIELKDLSVLFNLKKCLIDGSKGKLIFFIVDRFSPVSLLNRVACVFLVIQIINNCQV